MPDIVLRASWRRIYATEAVVALVPLIILALVGLIAGYGIDFWFDVDLATLAISIVGAVLARRRSRRPLAWISKDVLRGPEVGDRKRARIPVDHIDWPRTRRRTPLDRLLGYWTVWATDGQSVRFNTRWFSPETLNQFALRLGDVKQ